MPRGLWLAPPPLPREHGSWAMLAIPPILGAAAAWPPGAAAVLLAGAVLLLFLSRHAAVPAAARVVQGKPVPPGTLSPRLLWGAVYLGASLALLLSALSLTPPRARSDLLLAALATVVLGGAQTFFALAGRDRSPAAEILGMAGLASAAPLIVVSAGRPLDGRAAGVGMLALAYFLSSLAYVRAVRRLWRGDRSAAGRCVAAHCGVLLGLVALCSLRWLPALSLLSMAPVLARTAWGLISPPGSLRLLGLREIGVAVLFAAVAAAALTGIEGRVGVEQRSIGGAGLPHPDAGARRSRPVDQEAPRTCCSMSRA